MPRIVFSNGKSRSSGREVSLNRVRNALKVICISVISSTGGAANKTSATSSERALQGACLAVRRLEEPNLPGC